MEPTIKSETYVVTRKIFLSQPHPQRGDIVIYKRDLSGSIFVGRVIALPKESVRFNNGNLYINNDSQKYKVEEAYLPQSTKTYANTADGNNLDWTNIGEFSYLILPDKRDNRFNIEDQLINKSNIESVVIYQLQ